MQIGAFAKRNWTPASILIVSKLVSSYDAGAGKHTYILRESGDVINVDNNIARWNNMNWIEVGYKEGDTFSIYGNEYAIDSSGHIHVSVDDTFTSTEVKYPKRTM